MKTLWKRATGLLLSSALIFSLAACGGGTGDTNTKQPDASGSPQASEPAMPDSGATGEKLVYTNGGPEEFFETPWLNPGTYVYNKAVYGHLIVADENLNPIPDHPDALATYEYSTDGKTLTFTLRDDAYWHNGDKVTPEDIKWSIEFVSKTPVANAVFVSTFSAIEGSKTNDVFNETFSGIAIDGQKITITFDKIAPDALLTFTQFAPVPKSEFEGIDPLQVQQAPFFQHPIGCGPFMVEEVNMKNYTILAPFDKYYNGVADFKIQMLPSAGDSDPNVVTRAKSGNLDYGYTKMISDVQALEGTPGITITPIDVRYTRLFFLNKFDKQDGSPAPLADARVRQAIRYAIDMSTICETLFQGAAVPANAMAPDANLKDSSLNDYNYDPAKAKELLADNISRMEKLIENTRSFTFEISPPLLYEAGLDATLEACCGHMFGTNGVKCDFRSEGTEIRIAEDTKVLLYQMAHEILVNVAKHAKARNVLVMTRWGAKKVQLFVRDDGVGFDQSGDNLPSTTSGMGLFSIRERMSAIGGQFNVISEPGAGTTVSLIAPIRSAVR